MREREERAGGGRGLARRQRGAGKGRTAWGGQTGDARDRRRGERERENDFIGAVACSGNGHHAWYLFNMV